MSIAIFIGLMHSFSPLAWEYSITAEVFALHNFFVATIVHTTIRFALHGNESLLLQGAFLCGLALTNQHTSILLSIPLILWVLSVTKLHLPIRWRPNVEGRDYSNQQAKIPLFLKAAFAFLSGLIGIYGTMPIFANLFHHAGSWGDISSFRGFMHHFLRSDYGSLKLYSGNDDNSEGLRARLVLWGLDFIWSQSLPFIGAATLVATKDLIVAEICKLKVSITSKRRRMNTERGVIVASDDASIGIDTAILCSLVFYLVVFHSLANLPIKNPLFFGIHQVSNTTHVPFGKRSKAVLLMFDSRLVLL